MRTIGIIPARLDSKRLPRKLLLEGTGKPLIQHTWESAYQAVTLGYLDDLYIATDSVEIEHVCRKFTQNVLLTGEHICGTDRIAEAVVRHRIHADVYVNIQADEPHVKPDEIQYVASLIKPSLRTNYSTLAQPLKEEDKNNTSVVKVFVTPLGYGYNFLRSVESFIQKYPYINPNSFTILHHIGIYAFTKEFLDIFSRTPRPWEETAQGLEQLRALSVGLIPVVGRVMSHQKGIDTQEDYDDFLKSHLTPA